MEIIRIENKRERKKLKVAAYARVSALVDYEEQGESVDKKPRVAAYVRTKSPNDATLISDMNQTAYFDSIIKNNPDWEFAGIYADYGKSGITVKNRPEFLRMIEDAKTGKMDVILTRSISRFSRNTQDFLEYTKLLKGLGVEIWFENERLSTMDGLVGTVIDCWSVFLEEQGEGGETAWKL